jgi:uncharacterized paraquat-inducible protein A
MVRRNLWEKIYSSFASALGHPGKDGKCYCSCQTYCPHDDMSCDRCGMELRELTTSRKDKEKLKHIMQKIQEQDRIIRIIKKTK